MSVGWGAPLDWDGAFVALREPKACGSLCIDEDAVRRAFEASPVAWRWVRLDPVAWREWCARADYEHRHPGYYADNLAEKSLEHFWAAQALQLRCGEVYLDIASQNGVAAEIYGRLHGVDAYHQDMGFPAGVKGRQIGGDACDLPLPDAFADAIALHCSFEHFEGDRDRRFLAEVGRVLRPGGRCVIVPLYLFQDYRILTDPLLAVRGGVEFEPDVIVQALAGYGNRHGRFYDVWHFLRRVWEERGSLTVEIQALENRGEFPPLVYARYALLLRKPCE